MSGSYFDSVINYFIMYHGGTIQSLSSMYKNINGSDTNDPP